MIVPAYSTPTIELATRNELESPAWYTVPLIILLSLSLFVIAAVEAWCVIHGSSEVLTWYYINGGVTVVIHCK